MPSPLLHTSRNHGLAALFAATAAWLYLGAESKAIVYRAIVSAGIAGLFLGQSTLYLASKIRFDGWKSAATTGIINGVLLHPLTWVVFVLWTRWAVLFEGGAPAGTLFNDLYSALVWSLGSAMYGFLLTIPAMTVAAYLSTKTPK
jgi:hypothetical protein